MPLTSQWIDAAAALIAIDAGVQAHGEPSVVIQMEVDDLVYHLSARAGRVEMRPGPHANPDIRLIQTRPVAEGIAEGSRNARDAFIAGDLRLDGHGDRLLAARPLLEAVGAALTRLSAP